MKKTTFLKTLLMTVGLCMGGSAWAEDIIVDIPISESYNICGANNYGSRTISQLYIHSAGGNYGEAQIKFVLDEDFDVSKVKSASLELYTISKSTRTEDVNIYSATGLSSNLNKKNCGDAKATSADEKAKIFAYGSGNTRSYGFSGSNMIASKALNLFTTSDYTSIDITTYIQSLTSYNPGDPIYIGVSATDAKPLDLELAGYQHANASKLVITYTNETMYDYSIKAVGGGNVLKTYTSGSCIKGTEFSSYLNKVLKGDDGKYYVLDDGQTGVSGYLASFTMGDDDGEKEITYTLDETIVYFEEGESKTSGSTIGSSYSGGAHSSYRTANSFNSTVISDAGAYKAELYVATGIYEGRGFGIFKKVDDAYIALATKSFVRYSSDVAGLYNTDFFNVNAGTTIYTGYTSNSLGLDYLIIRKVANIIDANNEFVGKVDQSTTKDAAQSSDYVLKPGDTKVLTFKNHGSAVGATSSTWGYNWRILVKEGETYKAKVRADSYDETASAATKTAYRESKDGGSSTVALDWNDFAADMADATVVATFAYGVDGTLAITTTSTGTANGYIYYVDQDVTGLTGNVTVNLSVEKAWLEVLDVEQTTVGGTIGATGYATFSSTYALDFTDVEDLEAYTATVYNGSYVTMSKVTGTVAANTGLVLVGSTASIPVVASGDAPAGNLLVACSTNTEITPSATGTNYVLSVQDEKVVFAPVTGDNATVTAGHAFLYVPTTSARTLSIVFADDETTGISDASRLMDNGYMRNDNFFNLNGQRVEKPAKGLYIVNGKKVVVK